MRAEGVAVVLCAISCFLQLLPRSRTHFTLYPLGVNTYIACPLIWIFIAEFYNATLIYLRLSPYLGIVELFLTPVLIFVVIRGCGFLVC